MKRNFLLLFTMFFFLTGCSIDKKTTLREQKNHRLNQQTFSALTEYKKNYFQTIENFLDSLTPHQQVAQIFLVNLNGKNDFVPVEKASDFYKGLEDITDTSAFNKDSYFVPGGFIFFSYNLSDSPEKIMNFTSSINNFCRINSIVPPYLSVDQEGGLVNRLRNITSSLPSCQKISENMDKDSAYELYEAQAVQLKALGFNMNLAPIAEIKTDDNEKFLVSRSFGSMEKVIDFCISAVTAYEKNGISTVLKHFPGNTNSDPHTGLPEITLPETELENLLKPFCHLVKYSPSAVLMSHARTTAHDRETPSCLSKYWVTEKLIEQMEFNGLVISDDIFMAALEKNGFPPEKAAVMAIEAGVDVIMLSEKKCADVASLIYRKSVEDSAFAKKLRASQIKVIDYKIKNGLMKIDDGKIIISDEKSMEERMSDFNEGFKKGTAVYKRFFQGK